MTRRAAGLSALVVPVLVCTIGAASAGAQTADWP
jgi:hypothetical protein